MAGAVREIVWSNASDKVNRRLGKIVELMVLAENEYQELLQLWALHSNVDQDVANQLFEGTATAEQLEMAQDLRAAMLALHNIYDTAITSGDFDALRRMT